MAKSIPQLFRTEEVRCSKPDSTDRIHMLNCGSLFYFSNRQIKRAVAEDEDATGQSLRNQDDSDSPGEREEDEDEGEDEERQDVDPHALEAGTVRTSKSAPNQLAHHDTFSGSLHRESSNERPHSVEMRSTSGLRLRTTPSVRKQGPPSTPRAAASMICVFDSNSPGPPRASRLMT